MTDIGTQATTPITGAPNLVHSFIIPIVVTETHFKRGDILRLTIYMDNTGGGGSVLAHDPLNRDGTIVTPASTYPTRMEAHIPFKIDL